MLRKIVGFLFGFISCLSGMSILTIALLQGQAKIDNLITPPSNWELAIVSFIGIISVFLVLAIWPKETRLERMKKHFWNRKKIPKNIYFP